MQTMKSILLLFIALSLTVRIWAGSVYITIKMEDKPVAREPIAIYNTRSEKILSKSTDDNGYISLTIPEPGTYKLELVNKGATYMININNSTSVYTLRLTRNASNQWQLQK